MGFAMTKLELAFRDDMVRLYHVAAAQGYHATYFMRMVSEKGAVEAAKALVKGDTVQSGLFRLHELGLLHISTENLVLNPKYDELFLSSEKRAARERLLALGFSPGGWD